MNAKNLQETLMKKVNQKAEDILMEKSKLFVALLKYEIAVANTEIAMLSEDHGYDFKSIPDSFANSIVLTRSQESNGKVGFSIKIPAHAFKDSSESLVDYFKKYVVANVTTKIRNGI